MPDQEDPKQEEPRQEDPKQDEQEDGKDRRRVPRTLVDLQVDYRANDMFIFSYISDISNLGIFLRSNAPFAEGTKLTLRFTPPGESQPVELEGEVRWVSPFRLSGTLEAREPGMGIQFLDPPDDLKHKLGELVGGSVELKDES